MRSNNSWLHNSLPLVKGKNRCTMMINSQDAHALNVQEGEMVRVQSRVGEITIPVELCDDIMRGVISIPHGFGHNREGTQLSIAEGKAGVSLNDITDDQFVDGISGSGCIECCAQFGQGVLRFGVTGVFDDCLHGVLSK